MAKIEGAKVAILATDGFEQSELSEPRRALLEAGADVAIVSLRTGSIKGWNEANWGEAVSVDLAIENVDVSEFDALVLPGGQINPDLLRTEPSAVEFIRAFYESGKPLAAICHAPWLLIEADLVRGRKLTSYQSIGTDVKNAGGIWEDSPVVVDSGLVTSREPGDLDVFCAQIIDEVSKGRHCRSVA